MSGCRKNGHALSILSATVLLVFVSCLGTSGVASAAAPKVIRLAWGEIADPWAHDQSAWAYAFKHHVESLSGGKMEVLLHPADSLGSAAQRLDLLVKGTIQITLSLPSGVIASKYCPVFNAFTIPYLLREPLKYVPGEDEILAYVNSKLEKACGVKAFDMEWTADPRILTNSVRPITKPADLKGLKIRVMEGEIYATVFKLLGASPVAIPWAELYTALQSKIADGQENPAFNIVYKTLHETQKYATTPGPFSGYGPTGYYNAKWYASLTPEERGIVNVAVRQACDASKGMRVLKNMEAQSVIAGKLQVHALTTEEFEAFRAACQPQIIDMMGKLTGGETEFVKMLVERARAAQAEQDRLRAK